MKKLRKPRILLLDIETSPLLVFAWKLWDVNIGLNQLIEDTTVLAWACRFLGEEKVYYQDMRKSRTIRKDKKILKKIHSLISSADYLCGHNIDSFDIPKLNARFIANGLPPLPKIKTIDTKKICKRIFNFTSNSLEFIAKKLNLEHKKYGHRKYPGMDLWTSVLNDDQEAWNEMKKYNILDVLVLEDLLIKVQPWSNVNYNLYHDSEDVACNCGSVEFERRGFNYSHMGKFQRYRCKECSAWYRGKLNLFSKEKRKAMKVPLR